MDFIHRVIEWTPAVLAVLGCALGWTFLVKAREWVDVPRWRRLAATASLILMSASISFGAFAWAYWTRSPEYSSAPPEPTYITAIVGFILVVVATPVLLCAKGRTRAMLALSSVGVFGFYFLMFLLP